MIKTVYEALAKELEAVGLPQMAAKARVGYYSDFDSTIAFPKMTLVDELRALGQEALAVRVIDGEFDG
jgi:hypothetical protein